MGIAASVVLVFVVDVFWRRRIGGPPVWWLHLADILVPSLLSIDAGYWLGIGEYEKAITVALMAGVFWWWEFDASLAHSRLVNRPKE